MTDEVLISKREVLEKTEISYGQLYRWKRKGLIPESWFIRRSTFTGQETFFPQGRILERIAQIKELKDEHALDDLAAALRGQVDARDEIPVARLRELGCLNPRSVAACGVEVEGKESLPLPAALSVAALDRLPDQSTDQELALACTTLTRALAENASARVAAEKPSLYLLRKRLAAAGISAQISLAAVASSGAVFDPEIEVVARVELAAVLERIQLDLVKGDR